MSNAPIKYKGMFIFSAILLLYIIIFISIAVWRFDNFCLHDSGDLLIFEQIIYNTLHGRPFYATSNGQNNFGFHNSVILAVIVPFAAVIPVPYLLYSFTVLSIAISAIPIFLIARKKLNSELLAILLGSTYIMLPAILGQVYQSFHEINLVLPFITFAFYFFMEKKFYPFIIMLILGLTVKEDVSLTFFIFAVYALIKKRDMKWYLAPAVLSVAWLIISLKIVIPSFNKLTHSYPMMASYFPGNNSFSELISNALFHPLNTLTEMTKQVKLYYLFVLLLPVGLILPFFCTEIIFVFPSLILNMLSGTQRFRLIDFGVQNILPLPRHMSVMAAAFSFIAAIHAIGNIAGHLKKGFAKTSAVLSLLLISLTVFSSRFVLRSEFYYKPSVSKDSINRVISLIPRNATVKADIDVANHLYDRKEVYFLKEIAPSQKNIAEPDFIVIKVKGWGGAYEDKVIKKYEFMILERDIYLLKKKQ